MKLIGIDSSGLVAGVAVWEDGVLLAEETTNFRKTHSETLLPMLAELQEKLGLDLGTVDAVAVASGPGSFTGLRIGAATAKGLGLALDIPVVPVPTLEGLAYGLWGTDRLVCPLMDARRNQVYAAGYVFEDSVPEHRRYAGAEKDGAHPAGTEKREADCAGESPCGERKLRLRPLIGQCAVELAEFLERAAELCEASGREAIFLGDGVPVYKAVIREKLDGRVRFAFAPAHQGYQRAGNIAALGAVYFAEGRAVSSDELAPEYLRVSQAEREGAKRFEI